MLLVAFIPFGAFFVAKMLKAKAQQANPIPTL